MRLLGWTRIFLSAPTSSPLISWLVGSAGINTFCTAVGLILEHKLDGYPTAVNPAVALFTYFYF